MILMIIIIKSFFKTCLSNFLQIVFFKVMFECVEAILLISWDLIPQTGPAGDKAVSASFMVDIF